MYKILKQILFFTVLLTSCNVWAQRTQIKGYAHAGVGYVENKVEPTFFIGEQDLFITSNITDRISFLGETVFRFSSESPTNFNVSIERLIISYNFAGNHNLIIGKHHTPVSYWNDTYHHGRVFFPTVNRPLVFSTHFIEIHTTGIGIQGFNLGSQNFGYQLIVGNGIGSKNFNDNNTFKSVTLDLHLKPISGMKFGLTGYMDKFPSNARENHNLSDPNDTTEEKVFDVFQITNGAYFKYFKGKYEFLTEAFLVNNQNDSTGHTSNHSFYAYAGYKITDKIVPYVKYDMTSVDKNELFLNPVNQQLLTIGIRYEFSFLAVAKLEYNRRLIDGSTGINEVYFQFAVGF